MIPPSFLDELRARTSLSGLIGRSVKLVKAGREHKGCCPFHSEKTPSFTVNDEKGFWHCFGCQAHGDALRWLTDAQGMGFLDAVRQLADAAGMEVPAPSPEAQRREAVRAGAAEMLERAARWYAAQLRAVPRARAALAERGLGEAAIERFGLGYAPPKASVVSAFAGGLAVGAGHHGAVPPEQLEAAGLLIRDERSGLWRDRFARRFMIPIHDGRGRVAGFAGRDLSVGGEAADPPSQPAAASPQANPRPKYINSPESEHFRKGELLFNLHRAAPAARAARRLVIVEGQFDAIALDLAGIGEAVAPMGTALTEKQLERAWRVAHCPVLLLDGDKAGRAAALKAAERALPMVGPGRSLAVAELPEGEDPDSFVRAQGREAVEAVIAAARPLSEWLFDSLAEQAA